MKRTGNLYYQIYDLENLELDFWKAQRGKSGKIAIVNFRKNLSQNLQKLRQEFIENWIKIGDYHYFTVYDPKKRTICAAAFKERVIQHAVVNICDDYFEKYQIFDSYACRKGKGVDSCLKRAVHFCKKFKWFLKLDIHKYFDSIEHNILLDILKKRFKDRNILSFFTDLLNTYDTSKNKGIPIGNLLSQYFANIYLAVLDNEIKDRLKIKGYIRYMDDFICFADEKIILKKLYGTIKDFLKSKLDLELNKPMLNKSAYGIPFLSYIVYPDRLRLSLKAKRRFKTKMKEANRTENADKALALIAFVNRADSLGFRRNLL